MARFLNTTGSATLSVAICDRCRMKRRLVDLESDGDAPGLRVCKFGCSDEKDPYKLPPRVADRITVQYPRPDEDLTE